MPTARSKPIFHFVLLFILTLSLLGSAVVVTPAYASSITVNSSADTNTDDGTCTLREAVANATSDSQLYGSAGECATGAAGADTISFDSNLSGSTIYLASTLTLNSNMTIDGSGLTSQITISGDSDQDTDGDVEVFSVNTGATVTLNSLIITKGSTNTSIGGGIYNASGAVLTVTNSTLSGNTTTGPGGGIKNDGTLTITNSTFSGNSAGLSGGGIRNAGTLTVTNSTFSGNVAVSGSGGGIYVFSGTATVTNSTFSANQASSQGGGIYYVGTLNYANTIIANSTSGGDCAGSGTLGTNLNNLVEDGGCSATTSGDPALDSLSNNGGPNQTFALIAGSSAIDTGDTTTCTNSPVNNLDQRGVTRPVGAACDIGAYEGSIPDVSAPSVNTFTATNPSPSLSIPITAFTTSDNVAVTEFLITESDTQPGAGDSGWSNSLPATYTVNSLGDYTLYPWAKDAAGNVSTVYGAPAAVNVCYASITVTSSADSGAGTLRQAIADTCTGGTIDFDSSLAGTTIHLASTLTLAKNVTIDGSGLTSQVTISGDNAVRVFLVNTGITATLNSLAITKGSTFSGGGIRNDGTLTITNSTLSDNSVTSGGGGIFNNNSGTLTIANSTFSGNSATSAGGGGIHNQGTLTITNSTLSGNSATGFGGGIYNNGGTLNYANTIIANSTAGGDCVNGGTGSIGTNTNNLVEDASCLAALSGDPSLGSLADNGGPTQTFALLTGSSAINAGDNTACANAPVSNLDQRGVTRPQGGQCDIGAYEYQATVTSNADSGAGTLRQAIADAASGDTIIFDSSLSGSTIYLASTLNIVQNMTIDGSALASKITVSGDSDNNGSADVRVFFIHSGMTVTLDSLIITKGNGTGINMEDNTTGGGGIQNNSGNTSGVVLTVKNSIITGNTADTGGGIYNRDQSTLTITNSTVSGNTATGNGGGIYSDGTLTVATSTVSGNSAGGEGGGIRDGSITILTNSTIAGNSATGSGGGIRNAGNLTAKNNTISGNSSNANGGGIYSDNVFNATNNIIANSTSGGDCSGQLDANLHNLVEEDGASNSSCTHSNASFLTGDPGLDSLTDNGGPTLTLALTIGSSAIDAGDSSTCTSSPVSSVDQRGVARPVGAACDIGAYEGAKDITIPTVTAFNATSPSTSLSIPITTFSATDNVAVTGYIITETSTSPLAGESGWTVSAPSIYTVSSDGTYTLYPWAKDAAGNVSALFGSPVSVTVDTTAPTVTGFSATSPSTSLSIPITTFSATDNVAVTGYMVTETSTPPLAGESGWTVSAPSIYTVSSDGTYTLYPWAKDAAGNVSALFGSPISVTVDTTHPTVSSIALVTTSPSAKTSVQFAVTFSESVSNVETADFSLTSTVTGASVSTVSGSGATRTVTVSTGTGNGTIRLDIPNTAVITDQAGNAITSLPYTSGASYTINKTLTYTSTASQDGWILESTETSNTGGTLNTAATTFNLGDDALDKQYRAILSFNTTSIPDNATISQIAIKIKRIASGFLTGNNNPFSWGSGLKVDVCQLRFGTTNSLQLSDFGYNSTTNCKLLAATFGSTPSLSWYSANLVSSAFSKLNKTGLTQFRLRFAKDDNDDSLADYLKFYSGNATAASRPQLVITYSVP